jgi:hypothetical protein
MLEDDSRKGLFITCSQLNLHCQSYFPIPPWDERPKHVGKHLRLMLRSGTSGATPPNLHSPNGVVVNSLLGNVMLSVMFNRISALHYAVLKLDLLSLKRIIVRLFLPHSFQALRATE